ncbi:MAG: bifunctional 2-polyprenyl-6-hydroxyphenol methylase/3-demethylubiquinol 3-O-methyltransferase UbiG [Gammaproteobacteria bacterium]|nr:bifunctional 2-polyprenyl-6-hydroxyphenol methylase/3-demethylubiquinol 3-O-methyltransferase UbiG [Gammaproteobacteria bacterium]
MHNVAPEEVAKFDALAEQWWDPAGDLKTLHDINPTRLGVVAAQVELQGARVVDVGCGGGILSEALACAGARVTGIDLSETALQVAGNHARHAQLTIDYRAISAAALAMEEPSSFDVVVCMELLEHVPDPGGLVHACADLAAPGAWLFFATLNRTAKAYTQAVLGAEYLLRLLPRGTHDYRKFVRPSELAAWTRECTLTDISTTGMRYDPFSGRCTLSDDHSVNYILSCRKPHAE